jgi:hypothetical protein
MSSKLKTRRCESLLVVYVNASATFSVVITLLSRDRSSMCISFLQFDGIGSRGDAPDLKWGWPGGGGGGVGGGSYRRRGKG